MNDILFITDGGPTQGIGHVFQSIAVADAVSDNTTNIRFSLPEGSSIATRKIRENNYEIIPLDTIEDTAGSFEPDTVVIDLPQPSSSLIDGLPSCRTVVYGNPETNISSDVCQYADFIVTPLGMNAGFAGDERHNDGTVQFAGPPYLILRDEFSEYANAYSTDRLERILLTFGGADPLNLTTRVLADLAPLGRQKIDVVIGPAFDHYDEFTALVDEIADDQITVHEDTDEMASLMYRSDLVITSPGITMFESLFIGVPTVGMTQNQAHRVIYDTVDIVYNPDEVDDIETVVKMIYREHSTAENKIGKYRSTIIDIIQNSQP